MTIILDGCAVLKNVDLSIDIGEHVAILGPNGAGKSSLIKTVTRELYPRADSPDSYLRILGKDLWNVAELRTRLGIVGPDILRSSFRDFSCKDIVLSGFFGSVGIWPHHHITIGMQNKASESMELMGIHHLGETSITKISTGESRLVMIARALVNDPLTMLLDEPTSNLDPRAAAEIRRMLRRITNEGKGIIMITHNMTDIIPEIQRVVLLQNGKIVEDGDKDSLLAEDSLSELFGVKLELMRRNGYYYYW
ncbi:ABC transporter ATP-binding protein [Chloroflexota bacterium]